MRSESPHSVYFVFFCITLDDDDEEEEDSDDDDDDDMLIINWGTILTTHSHDCSLY